MALSRDLKFAICFGLIIGALFSFCSMCFADETVDIDFINDRNISTSGVVIEATGRYIGVVSIEPGYTYTFSASSLGSSKRIFFGDDYSLGTQLYNQQTIDVGTDFVFTANSVGYLFFVGVAGSSSANLGTITRTPIEGMTGTIDNLVYTLSFNNLWGIVGFVVPILGIAILLVLGFYLIKRLINRIKRTKGGV